MSTPGSEINAMFISNLGSQEGMDKNAEFSGSYIRDRLREVSFMRKIIPPEPVTKNECQRSTQHDTLVKIIDIEPESRGMPMTFRGEPTANFIEADRFEAAFFTIASQKFEKTEQELLAYEMPVTKILEDNSVKDMQEVEDLEGLLHIDSAIEGLQTEANGGAVAFNRANLLAAPPTVVGVSKVKGTLSLIPTAAADDFTVRPLQRPDIVELCKLLSANRLKPELLLMTEPDFEDILQWTTEDMGAKNQSETMVDGYKYNLLMGKRFIRTIKTDILRQGNVYVFTAPEFFGKFYILNNTKFWIDKRMNLITWASWEDIAIALGNIAACRKLELYQGSVTPGATNAGFAARIPSAVEDLGARNNRAAEGLTYPQIDTF